MFFPEGSSPNINQSLDAWFLPSWQLRTPFSVVLLVKDFQELIFSGEIQSGLRPLRGHEKNIPF